MADESYVTTTTAASNPALEVTSKLMARAKAYFKVAWERSNARSEITQARERLIPNSLVGILITFLLG